MAGRAGGIPMQFPNGYESYLVSTANGLATRVVELFADPSRRRAFGEAGREHVRRGYLLPRLLRDELRLIKGVLDGSATSPPERLR